MKKKNYKRYIKKQVKKILQEKLSEYEKKLTSSLAEVARDTYEA